MSSPKVQDPSDPLVILKSYSLVDFFYDKLNINLEKVGKNYSCPCPIHKDTKASFYVDPDKNKCACYGSCNFKGDIVDFTQKYKNLSFNEALEWLCNLYKIPYRGSNKPKAENDYTEYYKICEFTSSVYHELLKKSGKSASYFGKNYLKQRKITKDIIIEFCLGVAPEVSTLGTWTFLVDQLKNNHLSLDIAEKIGIIKKNESNKYYDAFHNRIIFPIFDVQDRCIGFNSRSYGDYEWNKNSPKYLLTRETPIFRKDKFIYGLNKSIRYIKQENTCIIVEGGFDFLRMYNYGFKNTIPLLGGKVFRELGVDNYISMMDPDKAGIKYSIDNSIELLKKEKTALIAVLKKDPDDCSKKEIEDSLNSVVSVIKFYLYHNYKYKDSVEHKLNILDNLCKRLNGISNEQLVLYCKELANELSIPEKIVLYRFKLENKLKYEDL